MAKVMKSGSVKGGKTGGNYGASKPKKGGLIFGPAKSPKAR